MDGASGEEMAAFDELSPAQMIGRGRRRLAKCRSPSSLEKLKETLTMWQHTSLLVKL